MDIIILARIYSLIAEMEALKADIEFYKAENAPSKLFSEKADQIRGIASELQTLGGLK